MVTPGLPRTYRTPHEFSDEAKAIQERIEAVREKAQAKRRGRPVPEEDRLPYKDPD